MLNKEGQPDFKSSSEINIQTLGRRDANLRGWHLIKINLKKLQCE